LNSRNRQTKDVLQTVLLDKVENWNFLKQDDTLIDFFDTYKANSEDISCYHLHALAVKRFNSNFWFDGGYSIDERKMKKQQSDYIYPKVNNSRYLLTDIRGYWDNVRTGKSSMRIDLRQGSQDYNLLDSPYKIVWSYANTQRFFFTDKPVIWARNQFNAIGSSNKKELFYLFALLNSSVSHYVITKTFKLANEDTLTIAIGLKNIKTAIRVPIITAKNKHIKTEIIEQAEYLLDLEKPVIKDYVEFDRTTMQIFDFGRVVGNNIILDSGERKITGKIKKDKVELVKSVITAKYPKKPFLFSENEINLSELKFLPVIDFNAQEKVKKYIDDLVFALYFNIELNNIGIENSTAIHNKVAKNDYYFLVNAKKVL
jgi:hypothetical protein